MQLIFDGAATHWLAELVKPEHRLHGLYSAVEDTVAGACGYCAGAFGMEEAAAACGAPLLKEFDGHPSIRKLINEGYTILNY
ncbi:DsrE family protein [Methylocaldum sp. 14B]|uniref:DsrE family protein n=1 Tax=Methylocaldum sp. 14B TaxID=1912213 RepID=UPI00197C7F12|nr:DsrE family protein [Methylocaldum sp. 14B]